MSELSLLLGRLRAAGFVKELTAEQAAKLAYTVLRNFARDVGHKPDVEVMIRAPGEPRHFSDNTCWVVAYEAGPHEWAVAATLDSSIFPALVEPYYSFDLCFVAAEWAQPDVDTELAQQGLEAQP